MGDSSGFGGTGCGSFPSEVDSLGSSDSGVAGEEWRNAGSRWEAALRMVEGDAEEIALPAGTLLSTLSCRLLPLCRRGFDVERGVASNAISQT